MKQWHLLSSQKTHNIKESLALPQSKNQLELYKKLKSFINKNPNALLLYEGCEGIIDESFDQEFQGWNYKDLQKKVKNPTDYQKILTHVGLKVEVAFQKVDNQCGDNLKLIEKHQLAFSDLKAFLGYAQRLEQYENDPEKFQMYAKSMVGDSLLVSDPMTYALEKARTAFKQVKHFLSERNLEFMKIIRANKKRSIAVVIGGLHIEDFTQKLKTEKIPYKVYTPKGYPQQDSELLDQFEKVLFKE